MLLTFGVSEQRRGIACTHPGPATRGSALACTERDDDRSTGASDGTRSPREPTRSRNSFRPRDHRNSSFDLKSATSRWRSIRTALDSSAGRMAITLRVGARVAMTVGVAGPGGFSRGPSSVRELGSSRVVVVRAREGGPACRGSRASACNAATRLWNAGRQQHRYRGRMFEASPRDPPGPATPAERDLAPSLSQQRIRPRLLD
jgi:hypothetical protein